ncbi:MAG: hypothetical protein SGILL_001724 [Bacillariaceae sp.]
MRDIASLYGDQSSSLMSLSRDTSASRDPDGLDPSDEYYSSRLEPSGTHGDEEPEQEEPPEDEAHRHGQQEPPDYRDDGTPTNSKVANSTVAKDGQHLDLAMLVGIPPPPPPTAPPPKKGKRGVIAKAASPTPNSIKSVSSLKENETTSSFDKEDNAASSDENNFINITVPPSPAEASLSSVKSSSGALKDRSASSTKNSVSMQKAQSIVERRRQMALSTYESPVMVLDDNASALGGDEQAPASNRDPSMMLSKDSVTSVLSPREVPLSPTVRTGHTRSLQKQVSADSPSSAATKTHSNQTPNDAPAPKVLDKPRIPPPTITGVVTGECKVDASEKRTPPSPNAQRNTSDANDVQKPPKRGFSLERRKNNRSQTPLENAASVEDGKKQKKRGLLGKLFRGRKGRDQKPVAKSSEKTDAVTEAKAKVLVAHPTTELSPRQNIGQPELALESHSLNNANHALVDEATNSLVLTSPLKPALKSGEESNFQGEVIDDVVESVIEKDEATETTETPVLVKHEEMLAASSTSSPLAETFSLDPPDDEHIDPPMDAGPPLLSPTKKHLQVDATLDDDEQTRAESVRSKIAEVYGEHVHSNVEVDHTIDGYPANISNEQVNSSEPHDEVSILSGPSFESLHKKKSFDPSPKSHGGHFDETFDDDRAPSLRVEIQEHSMEPVGASPTKLDSARVDEEVRRPVFGDPIGNSPTVCNEIRAPSNDPLGDSPCKAEEMAKSPTERALSLLNDEDRIEIMQLEGDIGDPPLVDGYLSDDSGVDSAKDGVVEKDETPTSSNDKIEDAESASSDEQNICMRIAETNNDDAKMSVTDDAEKSGCGSTGVEIEQGETSPSPQSKRKLIVKSVDADDIEKSGFKSTSTTPTTNKTPLTVSAAAFTNAKAVAYFHQLDGDRSPRHSWHVAKSTQSKELAPGPKKPFMLKQMKKFNSSKKTKNTPGSATKKVPSPNEYSAENINKDVTSMTDDTEANVTEEPTPTTSGSQDSSPKKKKYVNNDPNKMFAAYSRFQGRRPTRKSISKPETPTNKKSPLFTLEPTEKDCKVSREEALFLVVPLGKITGMAVSRGVELRRLKREAAIQNGLSQRVVLTPREKPRGVNRFKMIRSCEENDIKDPIKRAGRRLLSKAAVPIQTAARRYLAKQEALDRMWAIIQIQSYIRRWRCETNFQAHIHSAILVQKIARGWLAGQGLKKAHASATNIQKIVRGYLAAVHAYDAIYFVCRIQAVARSFLCRVEIRKQKEAVAVLQAFYARIQEQKNCAATDIQRTYRGYKIYKALNGNPHVVGLQMLFRGYKARKDYSIARSSACVMQKYWRSYSACMAFQMDVADIITVQSVVRRWSSLREVEIIRYSAHSDAVTCLQTSWRAHSARNQYQRYKAATCIQCSWRMTSAKTLSEKYKSARTIQATWRGFQAYTDYIFLIVDVLVVQRKVRQWLAIKRANDVRKEKAAVTIQKTWKMHKAQVNLLYSLVHIIMVQSIARRFLSNRIVAERTVAYTDALIVRQEKDKAATSIQKAWRGFWAFSHFIIVRYEVTRIQALMRRRLAKRNCDLRLGCVILIQATARRFLASKVIRNMAVQEALVASHAQELRERNAANRVQFWWRIVLDWNKEKKAALTIERFFIFVKTEVDREIRRRETKRLTKEKKRRERRRESEDHLLEKVWLNTVDEAIAASSSSSKSSSSKPSSRISSRDAPQTDTRVSKGINPKLHLGGFNDTPVQYRDYTNDSPSMSKPPTDAVQLAPSQDFSVVSNITNPSVFHKMSKQQHLKTNLTEATEEIDFEFNQSFHKEVRPRSSKNEKKHRLSTEDYIRKYSSGLKTAPNRLTPSKPSDHFFKEHGHQRQPSDGTHTTFAQSHTQASTPVSNAAKGSRRRHSSGTSMSISIGASTPRGTFDSSPRIPSTPRSTTGSRSGSTPHAFAGARREGASPRFLPPATPTSRQKGGGHHISHRGTCETDSQTTMSDTIYSRHSPSPRRHSGAMHSRGGKTPVMIMKTYPDLEDGQSVQGEAHEVLLLGDEYGEV